MHPLLSSYPAWALFACVWKAIVVEPTSGQKYNMSTYKTGSGCTCGVRCTWMHLTPMQLIVQPRHQAGKHPLQQSCSYKFASVKSRICSKAIFGGWVNFGSF